MKWPHIPTALLEDMQRIEPRNMRVLSPADLARMDAYEDCNSASPASSLYWRAPLPLTGGGIAEAYAFNQPLPGSAVPIPSGDFRAWLAATGLPAFRGAAAT